MTFHYEDIFTILGDCGPFQSLIVLLVSLPVIVVAIQTYAPIFTLYTPKHRCRMPSAVFHNDSYIVINQEHSLLIDVWIPNSTDGSYQECCIANISSSSALPSFCDEYVYDQSIMHTSATAEWNFVCSKRGVGTVLQVFLWTGVMIGAIFFGAFSDKFGRSRAVNCAVCLNIVAGIALSFSPHYLVLGIFYFAQGFTFSGLLMSTFVLAVEHIGPSKRHIVSVVNHSMMAVGSCILAFLSYWIQDWRILQFAATASCLPFLTFFNQKLIPESPRWLFAKHKMVKLWQVLEIAAKMNKVDMVKFKALEGMDDASTSIVHAQPKTGRLKDVFDLRRPNFLCKSLIIFLNWFVITLLYYGLTMQASKVSSSMQLNLIISGSVEIVAYAFCLITMTRWGRRDLLVFCHFVAGVSLILTLCFPSNDQDSNDGTVVLILLFVGKWGASIGFTVVCIYTAEIFPTVVRNLGVGLASCCGRVGGLMAPVIGDFGKTLNAVGSNPCEDKQSSNDAKWPLLLSGSLALLVGMLTLLMPETLNEPLPETCEDAEDWGRLPCFRKTSSKKKIDVSSSPLKLEYKSDSKSKSTMYGSIDAVAPNITFPPKSAVVPRNHYQRLPSQFSNILSSSDSLQAVVA